MRRMTLIAILGGLWPWLSIASAPAWVVVPETSTLEFTATQNNAPVKGKFKQFEGDIEFSPNQLKDSKVTLTVDTNSVDTPLKDIAETLKTPDWLSAAIFPKATFETVDITKLDEKNYQASGNLTIRDKTFPALVTFSVADFSPEKANVKGHVSFKRTTFGVGKGEWASTNEIKDDIKVDFDLKLAPKS